MGRYGVLVVVAGALLVGLAVWFWPKGQEQSPPGPFPIRDAAQAGETGPGRSADVAAGAMRGQATPPQQKSVGEGKEGAAGARAFSNVKPRAGGVGEAVGGAEQGGTVEVTGGGETVANKIAALKPTRGAMEQVVGVAPAGDEGELPPEVVFEGGKERRFRTEVQVALEEAGKIAGDSGSMAFWVKPSWEPNDQNDAVFVQVGEGNQAIRVAKNVTFLRFEFFDADGRERGVGLPIDSWKPGEWHQVTATWALGRLQLYVDGKPVSENSFQVVPNLGENPKAFVGSKLPSGSPAVGQMADVRILNRPLQPAEIQELAHSNNRPE